MKKLIFIVLSCILSTVGYAYDFEVDGICYTITSANDLTVKVDYKDAPSTSKSNYYNGIITIPQKVTFGDVTFDVTCIGKNAFYGSVAETVIIPNSVTSLGESCFAWSDIKYITIPGSIMDIPKYAFRGCYSLEHITISNGVKYLGEECFGYVNRTRTITIPASIEKIDHTFWIGSGIRDIIFKGKAPLLEQVLPVINPINNKIAYVRAGEIDDFKNKGWDINTFIEFDEGIQNVHPIFSVSGLSYNPTCLVRNYEVAVRGCEKEISAVSIPATIYYDNVSYLVTSIGQSAFLNGQSIESLYIADNVKSIGNNAFANCKNLKLIRLEEGLVEIGNSSFNNTGISKIILPSTVTSIGEEAFSGCQSLGKIYSKIQNPFDAENAFSLLTTMTGTLYVPVGTKSLYEGKLGWKNFSTIIETNDFNEKYKLKYIVDGEEYKSLEIAYGANITPESVPTKEGYTFSGWSELPKTMPDHDVEVTGKFTINKYKLSYIVDGEEYKCYDVEYGALITPETTPNKEGYTFSGWSEIPTTMPARDVTITGKFTINKYKLNFEVDGVVLACYELSYGTKITMKPSLTKEGYTFSGWSEIPATMPAYDVTVTGTFTINKYKVSYTIDGEEYKSYETEFGSTITPETTPTKEGYTFSGWSEIPETMPAHDVMVTGTFTVNKYKLTYTVDGEEYKSYETEYGATITPEATPIQEGYTFSGWSEIPETMPAHDVTITGSFTINQYLVTYIVDGDVIKTEYVNYATTITPPSVVDREGYSFAWNEYPETMPAKGITVTGQYTINKYKLTYTIDGEEYKSYETEYGATITPEKTPTKEGYTFSGWSEIPATMPAHDVTVSGTFTVNKYKITYIMDNKVYKEVMCEYGTTVTPEPQPVGVYDTFEWIGQPETMPAHDVVVYAVYTSGIADALMITQQNVRIYTPNGKKLDKLQKGLNIVVLNDGTVKKVVIK